MRILSIKIIIFALLILAASLVGVGGVSVAFAHAVVSPSQSAPSRHENFSLGVPTEKDIPTIAVRLLIPEGIERITPFVKPGWKITAVKDESGEKTVEIRWAGGSIPPGQKDVFQFTARMPEASATIIWKAYQTYEDGTVVGWDRDPQKPNEGEEKVANPYSITEVSAPKLSDSAQQSEKENNASLISFIALAISLFALGASFFKKTNI